MHLSTSKGIQLFVKKNLCTFYAKTNSKCKIKINPRNRRNMQIILS